MPEGTQPSNPEPEIQFGVRHCEICHELVQAPVFGRHVLEHPPEELARWPGGLPGLLNSLRASVEESVQRAEGHPEVITRLKASLDALNGFLHQFQANAE